MVDQSIVTEWISKGEEDYNFARANLEEGKNFFAQICFHFQQAAEKYLKAFIIASDLEFRRIHDLGLLLKVCSAKDTSFEDLRVFVSVLYRGSLSRALAHQFLQTRSSKSPPGCRANTGFYKRKIACLKPR
jgi:HEPN domain-containing protein